MGYRRAGAPGGDSVKGEENGMTIDQLKELRAACNSALEQIKASDARPSGAINWADLRCVSAEWVIDDSGAEFPQVFIEEAEPGALELCSAIAAALEGRWPGVRVVAEW